MHPLTSSRKDKTNMTSDGYISFPDFEKFCQTQNPYEQHHSHTAVET